MLSQKFVAWIITIICLTWMVLAKNEETGFFNEEIELKSETSTDLEGSSNVTFCNCATTNSSDEGNSTDCEDVECEQRSGTCELDSNNGTKYICQCVEDKKRIGDHENWTCLDIHPCDEGQAGHKICEDRNAECTPNYDSYNCTCSKGYVMEDPSSPDSKCIDTKQLCDVGNRGYQDCIGRNATCSINGEEYECHCLIGYGKVDPQSSQPDLKCFGLCDLDRNKKKCEKYVFSTCDINLTGDDTVCQCPKLFVREGEDCELAPFLYTAEMKVQYEGGVYAPPDINAMRNEERNKLPFDKIAFEGKVKNWIISAFEDVTNVIVENYSYDGKNTTFNVILQFKEAQSNFTEKAKLSTDQCLKANKDCPFVLLSSLEFVSNEAEDPCSVNSCSSTSECQPEKPAYSCKCKKGYKNMYTYNFDKAKKYSMDVCRDIDECNENKPPCPDKNMRCTNTIGSHKCSCESGFKQTEDGSCVDVCDSKPCGKDEECVKTGGTNHACLCLSSDGCVKGKAAKVESQQTLIIVGAVLGAALFLTFIGSCIIIKRVKDKYKNDDNYERRDARDVGEGPGTREMTERLNEGRSKYGHRD